MSAPVSRCAVLATVMCVAAAGCGKSLQTSTGADTAALGPAGAGGLSTKNTTRVGGSDATVDAAAIARVVYPSASAASRPTAVVLVDQHDWPGALAASVLSGAPLHAPLLYTEGFVLPHASDQALSALAPAGASALGGIQAIRIGEAAAPPELRLRSVGGREPAEVAVAVEQLASSVRKRQPRQMIVTAWDAPPAMTAPAAGLAAQSGAPILFVRRDSVPPATRQELQRLGQSSIYVVGPASVVSDAVEAQLGRYGPVARISGGDDPASNAVAVARFGDGSFGWGIREAGHGFVFANPARPFDAPPAALLSASGDYAPLLLLDGSGRVGPSLARYMSDLQPGIPPGGPVRGVYNHGWLIGSEQAIPAATQAELDSMLEITSQKAGQEPELESSGSAGGAEASTTVVETAAPKETAPAKETASTASTPSKASTPKK